jgi:hypothetical protein
MIECEPIWKSIPHVIDQLNLLAVSIRYEDVKTIMVKMISRLGFKGRPISTWQPDSERGHQNKRADPIGLSLTSFIVPSATSLGTTSSLDTSYPPSAYYRT